MNVITRPGMSLAEFLDWERQQEGKFEFDGTRPIPTTGGTVGHARLIGRLFQALSVTLGEAYEAFPGELKVLTGGRSRYPDVTVLRAPDVTDTDIVEPVVVIEILSPSTAQTDLRDKPLEYGSVATIEAYVILSPSGPDGAIIYRRSGGWVAEPIAGTLALPEIGVSIRMDALYRT